MCSDRFAFDEFSSKTLFPIDVTEGGIVTWSKEEHPMKALSPIESTDEGDSNVICFNDLHPKNDDDPIDLTEGGTENFSSDEQSSKALFPIETTEGGIIICFNDEHPLKVLFIIDVIDVGIETFTNEEHL